MTIDLEKNEEGNIILKPITEWLIGSVGGIGTLLAIQYADGPEGIERGDKRKQAQFALTPQQALELAAELTRCGMALLQVPRVEKSPN